MSHFVFKAKRAGGEIYKDERDAKDRYELYKMIKESGGEVISLEEKNKMAFLKKFNITLFSSVRTQDKINLIRNLGSMIAAGLALSRALSVIEKQSRNKRLKAILNKIRDEINEGKTLSDAMSLFKNVFSPLVISMVRSGEESGTLAESLRVVALQMDKNYSLQKRIRGAMLYPGIIVSAMILIAIVMLIFVVPTLTKTFKDLNLSLPTSTKIVLWISSTIQNHSIFLIAFLLLLAGLFYLFNKSRRGKLIIHSVVLKIPVIGNLIKEVNSARTARGLSSLINSGVDILESLRITKDIVQNVHYKAVLEKTITSVEKGDSMSKVFEENTHLYPVFMGEMIAVGEETGKISDMLLKAAVYYEEDVDQKTKDMSTIIEPFLMIVIASAVAFFAISMISPMYSLVDAL